MTPRVKPDLTTWRHRCKCSPVQRGGRLFAWIATPFDQPCPHCGKPDPEVARRAAQDRRAQKLKTLGHVMVLVEVPKGHRAELQGYALMLRERAAEQRAAPCPAQSLHAGNGPASNHIAVRGPTGLRCCKCGAELGE